MTVYDLLKDNMAILRRFHRNGVAADSIRFVPVFEDWRRMAGQGAKKQYIEAVLAAKYGYTERYIRMIVRFMQEEVR